MAPKIGSVEVGPSPPPKGETRPRRAYCSPDKLVTSPGNGVVVLADLLEHSAKVRPNVNAVGWRELVKMHTEEKEIEKTIGGQKVKETKKWSYFEMSPYKFWTYKQFFDLVCDVSSGLVALGHTRDTIVNIYASTSPKWQLIANAAARQGITFATAYDSLGEEGLEHSINEPSVYSLFTNANLLGTLAAVIERTPSVKVIIYDGLASDIKAGALEKLQKINDGGIKVLHLDEVIELGKKAPVPANKPQPDDVACIMYTSGSTGAPKGVLLTNGNIVASAGAVILLLGDVIKEGESYIAYLPLAHIFEFVVEMTFLYVGIPMGYGTVKTLTDNSVRNCVGDIREFKPTIMVGVPAVWELIRKGILAKVKAGSALKQSLFAGAVSAKKASTKYSLPFVAGIMDAVVFSAVKQATGGRLRFALSGGAAISRDTQEFLNTALVPMLQGYGMTETCAMCAILPPAFLQYGAVGVPSPAVEIKLVDVPDANYFAANDPPQGEVWIRGPAVTKGYYKRDKETAESLTDDGWLKTGDIAQWNKDGTLSIIDRKKNLVKLAGGEYIALERLEATYKGCNYVSNIAVHADTNANRPMAIIFPNEVHLRSLIADQGIAKGKDDFGEICEDKAVSDLVLKEVNAIGKKAGFKPLEMLQTVLLTSEEWTPQNGLLTAAQKLQRKAIQQKFADQINKIYP